MLDYSIETKCIQSGYRPENGEPRVLPIFQSTTFKYDSAEHMGRLFDLEESGHMYSRISNPTVEQVEKKIADLEGGAGAVLLSSGQSANLLAVLNITSTGQNILALSTIYGGTFNMFDVTLRRFGIEVRFIAPGMSDAEIEALIGREHPPSLRRDNIKPWLEVLDIERYAALAPAQHSACHRQHLCHACALPAYRARRRYCHPFDNQIYGRTRHGGRGLRG